MIKNRDIYSERYGKKKNKKNDICRNKHLVRDFHKKDIVEYENDGYKSDSEIESELQYLGIIERKKQGLVDKNISGKHKKETGCEFQKWINWRDFFFAESTFSPEKYIRENREEVEYSECLVAFRTMTSARHDSSFSRSDTPNEY